MEGAGFIIATAEGGRHGTNAFEEERRALAKSNILIGGLDSRLSLWSADLFGAHMYKYAQTEASCHCSMSSICDLGTLLVPSLA